MGRLVLVGLLLALPLAAVPLVGAVAGGDATDGSLAEFRAVAPAVESPAPSRLIAALAATPRRVTFRVSRPGALEVAIRDSGGRLVRRLGHFSVPGSRRLILAWDGRALPAGKYVAVVRAGDETARARFRMR